jgi:4-hydroxy-2-oxoheptanedioate aldolase
LTNPNLALQQKWRNGETAFGAWLTVPDPFLAELFASCGYDFIVIDMQHGIIEFSDALPMIQAAHARGVGPIVRVLKNDPTLIGKALDCGAAGVIVPLVNNAAEAQAAVSACKYPPHGTRSWGPVRASVVAGADRAALNDVACICMVETEEGLANVSEIAAVQGLSGIYVGPSDLALALGLGPGAEQADPRHAGAIDKIKAACDASKVFIGMHNLRGEVARKYAQAGFRMVTVVVDAGMIRATASEHLKSAKAA